MTHFSQPKQIDLFLVGTGLIGSTLLKQIQTNSASLATNQGLELRILGLVNKVKMLLSQEPLELETWQKQFEETGQSTQLQELIKQIIQSKSANRIFVDCTASDEVASHYEFILKAGASIVTPNKRANSGPLAYYKAIRKACEQNNVHFNYETNVGAGLPVISTLQDLVATGDEVVKIEGVLSGTLSYLFNTFTGEKPFSQLVSEAREADLTEPDPREDLNGLDMARKLLILARETGLELELEEVNVENLIPESCRNAKSVDEFLTQLKPEDNWFEQKLKLAESNNKALRYIATLESDKARVALTPVDVQHPCYHLAGSDNLIVFTTKRYYDNPLVIKGPGAGAQVTAAGVLADIIKCFN